MKFYQTLKQPPRSAKDGKHRRASAQAYGRSADGAGRCTGEPAPDAPTLTLTYSDTWAPHYDACKPAPPAVPYAGIRAGEIIGHRLWWLTDERNAPLSSLAHIHQWVPGATEAGDVHEPVPNWWEYRRPLFGGVYAYSDQASIGADLCLMGPIGGIFFIGYQAIHARGVVVGTVKMWGEVIEHEHGYRAQFAKVNSLDRIVGSGDLDELRSLYGVAPTIKATDQEERK